MAEMSEQMKMRERHEDEIIEENYYRLIGFVVDVIMEILRKVIMFKIGHGNFQKFLNSQKHKMYHWWINNTQCCQCYGSIKHLGETELSRAQISCLFEIPVGDRAKPGHHKTKNAKTIQYCVCKFYAKVDVTTKELDLALACTILINCLSTKCNPLELKCIRTIKNLRNQISHVTCTQSLTSDEFNRVWEKLEYSILYLAKGINENLHMEAQKSILSLKNRDLEFKYCLKVHNILRIWEKQDTLLTEKMDKLICVQRHISSVLEGNTSKLEDLINGKVNEMAIKEKESIQAIREMQKSIYSLTDQIKTMRKMDEKQNKLLRTLARNERRQLNKNMCTNSVKDSQTETDKRSEFIRWKEENLAKLSIIIKKIFTLVLRRAFRTEWNRQYPNCQWLDNTASKKRLLELERRPSKRGRICLEQIRKGDGDVNSWDFSLLSHLLCHSKALDLKNRNIQLYNGTYQVLEIYKKFSGMKCFEINLKEFDSMYHQIRHCFEIVPEFRSSCEMLSDIKHANIHISLTEPSHQLPNDLVKRQEDIKQYLPWLLLVALLCLVYWGKTKIEEVQMLVFQLQKSDFHRSEGMTDTYDIPHMIAVILTASVAFWVTVRYLKSRRPF